MKKSLIALAVLAASGASFAQVTVTGNLTAGYQANSAGGTTVANVTTGNGDTAGFGTETAEVAFTAKEDLGGGFAATATLGLRTGATEPTAAAGTGAARAGDTKLVLVTPFGGFALGTVRSADYLSGGIAGVDAYYDGWNSKVLTARSNRDFAAYTVPVGALTLSIAQYDKANTTGVGTGTTGAEAASANNTGSASPFTVLSATYAAGPLTANAMYLAFKNNATVGANKDTSRLAASYDLGVAKIGAGIQVSNLTALGTAANPKTTDLLVAAKIPMGASSLGVSFVQRQFSDFATTFGSTDGTASGYALEYGYAMSKRTSLIANYARWTPSSGVLAAGQNADTQYQLLLSHSF